MEAWWTALLVVLRGFFVLLGLVVLGVLRQIGVIQRQLAESSPLNGPVPGTRAPDFTLPTPGEEAISLSHYRGRKVLLVFVASGCGPCKQVLPEEAAVAPWFRSRAEVLLISHGDRAANEELTRTEARGLPLVYEESRTVAQAYGIPGTPFGYLLDERGVIRSASVIRSRQTVEQLLGGVTLLDVRGGRVTNRPGVLVNDAPDIADGTVGSREREVVQRGG